MVSVTGRDQAIYTHALTILKMVLVPLAAFFVLRHVLTNDFTFHVLMVILCMPPANVNFGRYAAKTLRCSRRNQIAQKPRLLGR